MSKACASTRLPLGSSSFAIASSFAPLRAPIATFAPSRTAQRATSPPSPGPTPETITVLPARIIESSGPLAVEATPARGSVHPRRAAGAAARRGARRDRRDQRGRIRGIFVIADGSGADDTRAMARRTARSRPPAAATPRRVAPTRAATRRVAVLVFPDFQAL